MESTLERIDRIAFVHLLEKGYEGTNMRTISGEIGIKASSLYFYYKSKKDMFLAIYDQILKDLLSSLNNIIESNHELAPIEQLFFVFQNGINSCLSNYAAHKFILRYQVFAPDEIALEAREIYKAYHAKELEVMTPILERSFAQNGTNSGSDMGLLHNKFRQLQSNMIYEMILTGIAMKEDDILQEWNNFMAYCFKEK